MRSIILIPLFLCIALSFSGCTKIANWGKPSVMAKGYSKYNKVDKSPVGPEDHGPIIIDRKTELPQVEYND